MDLPDNPSARHVVDHLVTRLPGFLSAGSVELPPGPTPAADQVAAWQRHADAVRTLLAQRGDEGFAAWPPPS